MEFDIIESGFTALDESILDNKPSLNADSNDLHETVVLASLKSSENRTLDDVYLNCCQINNHIVAVINNSIRTFAVEDFSEILFKGVFDSCIDCYAITNDEKYIILCIRNGSICVIKLPKGLSSEKHKFVYAENVFVDKSCVVDSQKTFTDCFFEYESYRNQYFLTVDKSGRVIRISLEFEEDVESEGKVSFNVIYNLDEQVYISALNYPVLLINGAKCHVLNLETEMLTTYKAFNLVKAFPINMQFLCLLEDGQLCLFCPYTMLIFPIDLNFSCKDIYSITKRNGKLEQIMVYTERNELGHFLYCLDEDFRPIYSIPASTDVNLIPSNKTSNEPCYFSKIHSLSGISELRLHSICETEPEKRLERFLRKKQFEEAKQFALAHNLDVNIINKAKARVLISAIVEKSVCTTSDLEELFELLSTIDDSCFKLQCCMDVESYCIIGDDIRRVLNYGCNILPQKGDEKIANLRYNCTRKFFYFKIFVTLQYDIKDWLRFSTCNLVDELKYLLKRREMERAIVIYSQIFQNPLNKVKEQDISDIIKILDEMSPKLYTPFLPTFIPRTMENFPQTLQVFVLWLEKRAKSLEENDPSDFPQNAITFIEYVIKLLKVKKASITSFQTHCLFYKESIDELQVLVEALQALNMLKNEYNVKFSLHDYMQDPKTVIGLLLNNVLPSLGLDLYEKFLKDFLYEYILRNHLEVDDIFLHEIKELLINDEDWWLPFIKTILKCISCTEKRLEAIRIILTKSKVPWDERIREVGKDAFKYSSPIVKEIEELFNNEPMMIVLNKPEYAIEDKELSNIDDLEFLVSRMMYCDLPTLVSDSFQLCINSSSESYRRKVIHLLFHHFVKKGEYDNAFMMLDNNPGQEILHCLEGVLVFIEKEVNENKPPKYYKILKPTLTRIEKHSLDKFNVDCVKELAEIIESVHKINKTFKTKAQTTMFVNETQKEKLLEQILEEILINLDEAKITITKALDQCYILDLCLFLKNKEVIPAFCQKLPISVQFLEGAKRILSYSSNVESLCLTAVKLQQISSKNNIMDNTFANGTSFMVTSVEPSTDISVVINGLKISEKLLNKALLLAEGEELMYALEALMWMKNVYNLTHEKESPVNAFIFKNSFNHASFARFSSFTAAERLFDTYIYFMASLHNLNAKYLTHFNKEGSIMKEDELYDELRHWPGEIQTLCKNGQSLTAYRILTTFQSTLQCFEISPVIKKTVSKLLLEICIPHLLQVVLTAKTIDEDLLLNLLISFDKDTALKYFQHSLKSYKRQLNKFATLGKVGMKMALYFGGNYYSGCKEIVLSVKWWDVVNTNVIKVEDFFKSSPSNRLELMLENNLLSLKQLEEYCVDFALILQPYYPIYLQRTLSNWKLDYEITYDKFDHRQIVVHNDEKALLQTCKEIVSQIENKSYISDVLKDCWSKANFYNHEVFLCILELWTFLNSNVTDQAHFSKEPMLRFLIDYKRVMPPSDVEIEHWFFRFPTSQQIDPLSEFRLPFMNVLFTSEIWTILKPEINLQNYQHWFTARNFLKHLSNDDICSYLVKGIVSSGVLKNDKNVEWNLHPKFDDLFHEIDTCLNWMTSIEKKSAAAYLLLGNTPNGIDQVNMAKITFKYAQEYLNIDPTNETVKGTFKKVEMKYQACRCLHILHMYKLAEEEYVKLVKSPTDLVEALYNDERIVKKSESIGLYCPDINKAVNELEKIFGTSIFKKQHELLDNWLRDSSFINLNASSIITLNGKAQDTDSNLLRASYMCLGQELTYWKKFLWVEGSNDSDNEKQECSYYYKARALKCLCAISDKAGIESLTEISYGEFLTCIDHLTLLSVLESLGFNFDIKALEQLNKRDLIKQLVPIGSPVSIEAMATICKSFDIDDRRYWEYIIKSAVKFEMFDELKTYLEFFSTHLKKEDDMFKPFFINAWQKIIDNSICKSVIDTVDFMNDDSLLVEVILMIQTCPVVDLLNLEAIFNTFLSLKKVEYAAVLIQYVHDDKKNNFIGQIRNSGNDIFKRIDNLQNDGISGISLVKSLLL